MRWYAAAAGAIAALAIACDDGGTQLSHGSLSVDDARVAIHTPCLDLNGDYVMNAADSGTPLSGGAEARSDDATGITVPDFDADGSVTERDAAFLQGVSLTIDRAFDRSVCDGEAPVDFLVGGGSSPAIDCESGARAAVLVGVAGGIANLRDNDDGAGIRHMVNALENRLEDDGVQTLSVIAGPAVAGLGDSLHGGMEVWLTNVTGAYLERFPCAEAILIGHSHGAVTTDVVASRLEGRYAERISLVVRLDRIDELYFGDTASLPQTVAVLNVFETNDAEAGHGEPDDAPNVVNMDVSGETGPAEGEEGGPQEPVTHTTIDNSEAVSDLIVAEVAERLAVVSR